MHLTDNLGLVFLTAIIAIILYITIPALNNLYRHPLSRFPGPRLWAISRIPYVWTLIKGDLTQRTHELHQRYGPIVRLAPNELSFIDGQAWYDIYDHHQGRPNFPKNPLWMAPGDNGIHSILSANDADHARYRRLLSHAFSEKALRQQENLLQSYIALLVQRLRTRASSTESAVIDMVQWLNFTTFDIIGDLSLGESFHCLDESRYHSWLSILFTQFRTGALFVALRFFGLAGYARTLLPKGLLQKRKDHTNMANERIRRRRAQGGSVDGQRNDFMTFILRHNDEKGMSDLEIEATLRILVLAGSETTATALSGIIGNLLGSPKAMKELTSEIRSSFRHPSEICAERVSDLSYLGAVIEEGLRLCTPVALGMPRLVPAGGAEVSGHWLPEGTFVSASGYASNRSKLNFPNSPSEFKPSRWLSRTPSSDDPDFQTNDASSPSAFNPFSLGPRRCLGRSLAYLEMRLILAHLIWTFDFEATESKETPWSWEQQKSWILWEKTPLIVRTRCRV